MQKIAKLTQRLILIAQKYSMVLFSSLMMAICALILIEDEKISDNLELITIKIIIISGLGISLFFGLNMFGQRTGKRWISELIGLIFLLGFYFILPSHKDNWNITQVILILACFVLSHLLVSFAPYWKSNDEASFWQYNKSLFIGLIQTGIFTQVLTIGLLLALAAIENLFGIDFKEKYTPK